MKIEGHPYEFYIVSDGKSLPEENGYVAMAHGDTYAIRVKSSEKCRAEIKVDGASIGQFILEKGVCYDIERPVDNAKLLTFFAVDTDEAKAALQDNISKDNRGLIEVIFCPQKLGGQHVNSTVGYKGLRASGVCGQSVSDSIDCAATMDFADYGAGVSGLTGHSSQKFRSGYIDVDEAKSVTLRLRLVHDKNKSSPIKVTPLSGHLPRETEIPPALE
jgi:hypothetical protein